MNPGQRADVTHRSERPQVDKYRPETKRLRSHGNLDSECGRPRDQLWCTHLEQPMFRPLGYRFLQGSIPTRAA